MRYREITETSTATILYSDREIIRRVDVIVSSQVVHAVIPSVQLAFRIREFLATPGKCRAYRAR